MKTGELTSRAVGQMGENDNGGREGQGEGRHTEHDNVFNMSISQPPQESVLGGTTPSSTPRLRRRRRRALRLTWGVARVYHITALSEFAPQQIEETWWQAGEYAQIFHENAKLLDEWMKHGRLAESTDATFRGLEQMTHEEVQRRKRLRDQAMDAVLDEQDRQYEEENLTIPNPEGVAKVYGLISGRASRIARRRGLQDEEDKDCAGVSPIPMVSRDRLVHFCPMVHVQTGLHRSDYTEFEAKECWFSEAEVNSFKFHSKQVIMEVLSSVSGHSEPDLAEAILLDNSTPNSSKKTHTKICIRGLEPYLLSNKIGTRKQNVRKIWDVVLMQQDRHDSIQACLPAHLAQISQETSRPCIHVALRLGQQDESYVKKYLATEIHEYAVHTLSSHGLSEQLPRNIHCTQHQQVPRDYCRDSLLMVGNVSSGIMPPSAISASIAGEHSSGPLPQAPRSPNPLATASMKASTFDRIKKEPSKVARRSLLAMASPLLYLDEHDGAVTGKSTKKDLEEVTVSTSPSSPGASLPSSSSSSSSSSPESESSHVFRRLKALSLGHARQHDDDQWLRSPQRSSTVGRS